MPTAEAHPIGTSKTRGSPVRFDVRKEFGKALERARRGWLKAQGHPLWPDRQALRQVIRVSSTTVERAGKADSLKHIEVSAGTSVAVAVELRGPSDIVIRDRDGNILFAVDQSARTTTVGKQRRQRASSPPTVERALSDGCEGAFSPYAEPARAHVIDRCVSGVFLGTDTLA
jgi:hypothetical protein